MMSLSIHVRGLRLRARHGVLPQERYVGNDFRVDMTVTIPADSSAVVDDSLEGTINYAELVTLIVRQMDIPSALLEHVAGRIIRVAAERWPQILTAEVTVAKLAPPIAQLMDETAVTIFWKKNPD